MSSPLSGKRVINTRAVEQAASLDELLVAEGAIPLAFPCIGIEPVADPRQLVAGIESARNGAFDWVLFTSVNTVRAIERCLPGRYFSLPEETRIAAVGAATAVSASQITGRDVDLVPSLQHAETLAEELPVVAGTRVWLPCSSRARPYLAERLRGRGARVTVVTAYRSVASDASTDMRSLVSAADAVVFASPSAVREFARRRDESGCSLQELEHLHTACIGPTTHAEAMRCHIPNPLMADEPSMTALIQTLCDGFTPTLKDKDHAT